MQGRLPEFGIGKMKAGICCDFGKIWLVGINN
jgi:hypothetical protein